MSVHEGTMKDPIPKEKRGRGDALESWPIKRGQTAVMTEDWSYTHDIYPESTVEGKAGTEFEVDLYIPASLSDTGFAFYWGINSQTGTVVLCPAEYCSLKE